MRKTSVAGSAVMVSTEMMSLVPSLADWTPPWPQTVPGDANELSSALVLV